jgi:hypothetical protein
MPLLAAKLANKIGWCRLFSGDRFGSRTILWFALWAIGSTVFSTSHLWSETNAVDSPDMLPITMAIISFGIMQSMIAIYQHDILSLFPGENISAEITIYLSYSIGVAVAVGILWLPFDLLYDIHLIFLVINGIGFILLPLTFLVLHHMGRTTLSEKDSKSPTTEQKPTTNPSDNSQSATENKPRSLACSPREWKVTTWLLFFVSIPLSLFPGNFHIFMTDWYLWASNPDPLLEPGQESTTYTMNDLRPVISYWAIVIIGLYGILMIVLLRLGRRFSSEQSSRQASPLVCFAWLTYLLVFGALTGILFASGTVILTSGWLISLFIFSGLHSVMQLMFFIIFQEAMEMQRYSGTDKNVIRCIQYSIGILKRVFSFNGVLVSSYILDQYSGYPMLFKIYAWSIAASLLLWLSWPCFVSKNTNDKDKNTKNPNEKVSKTKPSAKSMMMVFKKSIKPV